MDGYLSDDLAGLPDLLSAVRDYAAEVLAGLGERPAAAQPKPASEEPLLQGVPVIPPGEKVEGQFFPLLISPPAS